MKGKKRNLMGHKTTIIKKSTRSSLDRTPPPQFNTSDLGSPKKVWSLLCEKDEVYSRNSGLFKRHPKLETKMRSVVLEWMMEVCADIRLHRETFHLAVDYFDRYLEKMENLDAKLLQLIASTALHIATKIEEVYAPKLSDITEYTDNACKEDDIKLMEEVMLQKLEWNFMPVTSVHWLALYLQLMNTTEPVVGSDFPGLFDSVKKDPSNGYKVAQTPQGISINLDSSNCQELEDSAIAACSLYTASSHYEEQVKEHSDVTRELTEESFFAANSSYNRSFGHSYFEQRVTVPKLMRGEFVRLTAKILKTCQSKPSFDLIKIVKILDLSMLDPKSLNFKYSELAAAVVLCCFEPEELIYQITDFRPGDLQRAREFMEPFVKVCEKIYLTGTVIPYFSTVYPNDRHNIQTYEADILKYLEEVYKIRKTKECDKKAKSGVSRSLKRKFGTTNNN